MTGYVLSADAFTGIDPGSAQRLRGPIGAAAGISRIAIASVGVRITIEDIARTDMRRIMTAPEVVGPIISPIARGDRERAAATVLDFNHTTIRAFAGLQKGLAGRCSISPSSKTTWTARQGTSQQSNREIIPATHEIHPTELYGQLSPISAFGPVPRKERSPQRRLEARRRSRRWDWLQRLAE
jgi:hypothetical protein